MKRHFLKYGLPVAMAAFWLVVLYSCAAMGTPNGGPYDNDPPRFVLSIPAPNQTNYNGKRVEITFDELVQLDNPGQNVIVTPPQMQMPVIRSNGRRVVVELQDDLQENTTYTIDFTSSIADNNEKNVLENFSFAFSTGEVIDSLEVSGILLNASNLEPMPGITVGLHKDLEDSVFRTTPFFRTTRTNDRGHFTIRNIAPGIYRIYGLNDTNRDYKFDQPGEDIAFFDEVVVPAFEFATRQDTLWVDSLTVDTIMTVDYTHFLPDDIGLFLFKEDFERQYLLRPERMQENKFTVRFNGKLDTVPLPRPLNFEPQDSSWLFIQTAEERRAVHYWITDPDVWVKDTLIMELTYPRSDSLNILQPQTDTLQVVTRRTSSGRRSARNKDDEEEKIQFISMNFSATGTVNTYDTVAVAFDEPVLELTKEMFILNQMVDTLWTPIDFELLPDSTNSLRFVFDRKWNYGEKYKIEIDSAAIINIYGKWNNSFSSEFTFKNREDYGHLYIHIQGVDTTSFVELLNTSDTPVRQSKVINGGAMFMNLNPGDYYARLVVDLNGNDVWDTGNYEEKRQPEIVYYCPKLFSVKQNWEVEETWNVLAVPMDQQKPLEITKNKPKEVTRVIRDHRNEGQQTSGSSSTSLPGGIRF